MHALYVTTGESTAQGKEESRDENPSGKGRREASDGGSKLFVGKKKALASIPLEAYAMGSIVHTDTVDKAHVKPETDPSRERAGGQYGEDDEVKKEVETK
ncbi:hypothetical protein PInf_021827 [Phytophthora infestans]|nr:hypothetical protein PInf_021827 [Phytophthora infestans]